MSKINLLDRLIYRLFFWRWQKIFRRRPDLRELFIAFLKSYDVLDDGEPIKVTVIIEKR